LRRREAEAGEGDAEREGSGLGTVDTHTNISVVRNVVSQYMSQRTRGGRRTDERCPNVEVCASILPTSL
jgi:hypothetical protein